MSNESIAKIARELAEAMTIRARTRLPEDQKRVLSLQTQLCQEWAAEREEQQEQIGE